MNQAARRTDVHQHLWPAELIDALRRRSELPFLRGTYYLWLVRVAELLPEVLTRPPVPSKWKDSHRSRCGCTLDLVQATAGENERSQSGPCPMMDQHTRRGS